MNCNQRRAATVVFKNKAKNIVPLKLFEEYDRSCKFINSTLKVIRLMDSIRKPADIKKDILSYLKGNVELQRLAKEYCKAVYTKYN